MVASGILSGINKSVIFFIFVKYAKLFMYCFCNGMFFFQAQFEIHGEKFKPFCLSKVCTRVKKFKMIKN